MTSTIVFVAVFLVLLTIELVLWGVFLGIGLRWARVEDASRRRIILAAVFALAIRTFIPVWLLLLFHASASSAMLGGLLTYVIVTPLVIGIFFKVNFLRAFQAWLPTLLTSVIGFLILTFVVRPLLFQPFVVPSNAMAPTILGPNWESVCPECGKPNYCTPVDRAYELYASPSMICEEFHVREARALGKEVHSGDRFVVAKFLAPRRWDIIAFHVPANPAQLYLMRLVGLPGETVHIEDGSLWINGEMQAPPERLHGLEYTSEMPDWPGGPLSGARDNPARLADDEYFVLGDFSTNSMDSRLWQQGAPGHNVYAVPESHITGVVTHTFWPPHRWRIHR